MKGDDDGLKGLGDSDMRKGVGDSTQGLFSTGLGQQMNRGSEALPCGVSCLQSEFLYILHQPFSQHLLCV